MLVRKDVQGWNAGGEYAPPQLPSAMPPAEEARKGQLTALERFKAKCEFMSASGCVLWRGGTEWSRDKSERTGVFWDGKRWRARRWAAVHIHGLDLFGGKEVNVTCGDPLCVQHVTAVTPAYPAAQFYVMRDLGYAELDERKRPDHEGPPMHVTPEWMK